MSVSGEQEFATEVAASVAHCFATITAFEQYPQWFSGIERAAVLERHADGYGKRVDFSINLTIRSIRYVLAYQYEKPTRLTWRSVDGDVESVEGSYRFEKLAPQRTRVTCRQAISLGFWIPGPIRRLLERNALEQSVREFKAAAEAAAQRSTTEKRGTGGGRRKTEEGRGKKQRT